MVQHREEVETKTARRGRKTREVLAIAPAEQPLFEALRAWRAQAAKAQHVPPYVIFHDRTLAEIAQVRPVSQGALEQISGVGEGKLARYGLAVLEVVKHFDDPGLDASANIIERAQDLRQTMSPPERLLWAQLSGLKLEGFKFRRQHPLAPYVLEFYCPEKRLAIEVDGAGHIRGDQPERDARRDGFLKAQGIRVLRFPARLVFEDMNTVVLTVLDELSR